MRNLTWVVVLLFAGLTFPATGAELEIQIVYDNTSARSGIAADWGFAAVVTFRGQRILFDSGTKPELFLENLRKLEIAPNSISHAVFSHEHGDHMNGIYQLFPMNSSMAVYFLDSFQEAWFQKAQAVGMRPQRVTGPVEIVPGIYTTGIVEGPVSEQALIIETSKGLVVLTGCSHPGVAKIVEAAEKQRSQDSVRLVLGGFHMTNQREAQIRAQIARLQELNVTSVGPTHCTGELAQKLFREVYGDQYLTLGAGKLLELE
ncbi:MAG: MBL fold metallo-hydrolase [Gemmatimonadota bacterium]|nr:MAG: MBL fold metallo-hydrolase [Gemmatimonadota bacterium]